MSESIGLSVFDSLSDPIAVLDQQGVIRNVNEAWRAFVLPADRMQTAPSPIGLNYVSICARAAGSPDGPEGPLAAEGIRAVIDGTKPEFQIEYPSHSPSELRWYRMTVTPLRGSVRQVLVRHINITDCKRAEIAANLAHALLRKAAEVDELTGLPNRTVLMQRLQVLVERARATLDFRFALLFLHLDRFKLVNDTLGHAAGDDLLIGLSRRLRKALPNSAKRKRAAGSLVARVNGDQFVYVACGIEGVAEAADIAERLRATLAAPYPIKGEELQSSVSIGIAMYEHASQDPQDLMRNANIALDEAKRSGVGSTVIFDQTMHDRLSRRLRIEVALRMALERRELALLYQPIVDLSSGRMTSVEALLRWNHPELGAVSPNEFIPIAEETELIVPIGEWVLRESCLQWARWQRKSPGGAPATVSVNLSRVQIALGADLLHTVRSALAAARMPAEALQLEITEREVMKDPAGARELILSLRDMGVRLAMDDFGTGTSSLSCLRDYPFHSIKIDKTFLTDIGRDPHVLAVAHATITVIESLGMNSVAEGIEEPSVLAMLQSMGCRCGQGYLFARPMPAAELLDAMTARCSGSSPYAPTCEPI
ncbi:MAG: EAL domain-containing protein [Steroidobacteraceae bacterium]